jgi:hypothetical protein
MNRQELELKMKQELAKLAQLNLEMRELVNKEAVKESLQLPTRYTRINTNN